MLAHNDQTPPAGRGRSPKGFFSLTSGGITGVSKAERLAGAGVDWYVTNAELNQAFPPQFTEYIGRQLMQHVLYRRDAGGIPGAGQPTECEWRLIDAA